MGDEYYLDEEQEPAHPGHGRLVLSEGDGPEGVSLLLLDLADTLEEHGEPGRCNYMYPLTRML